MDLYKNALALKVSGLNKTNKTSDFSLKNINIEVPYGSIVGNIGRNGAEKSTTISCILGMFQKDEGNSFMSAELDFLDSVPSLEGNRNDFRF